MKILIAIIIIVNTISCGQSTNDKKVTTDSYNSKFRELRWANEDFPIKIKIPKSLESEVNSSEAFSNAVNAWNSALGFNILELYYEGEDVSTKQQPPYNTTDFLEGTPFQINSVIFPSEWLDDADDQVLALTSFSHGQISKRIFEADIIFNVENYSFSTNASGERGKIDLESVLVHELGHLLGLIHIEESEDSQSIMNPTLTTGSTKRNLSSGDFLRIQEKYQTN
jgi:predicted Zn-dependent protease